MIKHESDPIQDADTQRDKPIPTNWVTKEDLTHRRPDLHNKIRRLDASEVEEIASKVGEALQETYWLVMGVILDDYLKSDEEEDNETNNE